MTLCTTLIATVFLAGAGLAAQDDQESHEARKPGSKSELRAWVQNMLQHNYSLAEMQSVTGLSRDQLRQAVRNALEHTAENESLLVLPYPGGRHPRIGFLEGAVNPQRETKVSVFPPWKSGGYAVADVPEAIWSDLGLTYLAHTHVPTVWTKKNVDLEQLEWSQLAGGAWQMQRRLPNGIEFGTRVFALKDSVRFDQWLTNGTSQTLTDLRVQNCIMLKGLIGFSQQTNDNKVIRAPFVATRATSDDGVAQDRWIIVGWSHGHRTWGNVRCPCMHADPKFPDCAPGFTERIRGWLSFYEGKNIQNEMDRIQATGWLDSARAQKSED